MLSYDVLTLTTLRQTTGLFPTQFEGVSVDGCPVYIRCKHGELRVHVGESGGTVGDAISTEPAIVLEFADCHGSELDWIEIEARTGLRYSRALDGVEIEDALSDDIDEIAALMRRVRDETMPYLPKLHNPAADRAFAGDLVRTSFVRVARADRIVGLCSRRPGWVDQLYVDVNQIGRGIGSRLLGEALPGVASVQLRTFQRNKAARIFYIRRSFDEIQRTDGSGNEESEPNILMRWQAGLRT